MEGLPIHFLVIDDNSDSRRLLVKTLIRKYPRATVHEAHQGDAVLALARRPEMAAIVAHRTYEFEGVTLVGLLRAANPEVPIIMVSGYDRTDQALAAGADAFLNYDQWLMIGTVVANTIGKKSQPSGSDESPASPAS